LFKTLNNLALKRLASAVRFRPWPPNPIKFKYLALFVDALLGVEILKVVSFVGRNRRGLIQPAIKCRGREYLRIIYGSEYTAPQHLDRLRARGLSTKRSLALREFALDIEALHRFVEREPLRRVHECVFGVLALDSEPVDPRL